MKSMIIFLLFLLKLFSIESARILAVFPTPSISHQVVFRPLIKELVKRGHEVTFVTTDPIFSKEPVLENLTEINLHNISYSLLNKTSLEIFGRERSLFMQVLMLANFFNIIFEEQIKSEALSRILQKDKNYYDLLLIEACVRPALVLSHVFKAPVIQISSLGGISMNHEALGIPMHPLIYFTSLRQKLYNLTFWDKLMELKLFFGISLINLITEYSGNEMLRRQFGITVPTISELNNNIDMLFLATNPIWAGNTPMPPNVIFIGGIHESVNEEIGKDLKDFLDFSSNGVIYVSFGTTVKTNKISTENFRILLDVFSGLKYDIIWKWDEDYVPEKAKNIKMMKWLPQSKLLCHPNVKLFITQGGLQSTDEAIAGGVPLIGIPMLADQWYNTEQYVHFKIGIKLNFHTLDRKQLREAIDNITEDVSYRQNVLKLRSLITDQPQLPLERAVWWTEYVLRNGGASHLRSPSANISWAEYLELELIFFCVLSFTIVLITFFIVIKYLLRFIYNILFDKKKEKYN